MNSAGTGGKAGAVAGLVYGFISGIFAAIGLVIFKSQIMSLLEKVIQNNAAASVLTASGLYNIALISAPVMAVVVGVLIGLILGLIFGAFHDKLPGKGTVLKGIFFGLILWLIFDVGIGGLDIVEYGFTYYLFNIGTGIIAVLAFGYVLSLMYERWLPPDEMADDLDPVN